MVKGSLSNLSSAGKLSIFLLLIIVFLLFSSLLGFLTLVPFMGTGITVKLASPDYTDPAIINALKALQIINMIGGLLLPAMFYSWLVDGDWLPSWKFSLFPGWLLLAASAGLFLVNQPIIGYANDLNERLQLPASLSGMESWMQNMELQAKQITDAFLLTTSLPGLLLNIFMIALLPAIAEEFVFRGVLARLFYQWTKRRDLAIFISSLIFAGIHLQFYGFLPRFLMGLILGYLFFWSGSLWMPMIAHFTNNVLSVLVEFMYRKGVVSVDAEQLGFSDHLFVVIISLILSIGLLLYIRNKALCKKIRLFEDPIK